MAPTRKDNIMSHKPKPTFYQDIQKLFTQLDRIKMMFYSNLDLWNYEEVKNIANKILSTLQPDYTGPGGRMPLETGPWSKEKINLFQ